MSKLECLKIIESNGSQEIRSPAKKFSNKEKYGKTIQPLKRKMEKVKNRSLKSYSYENTIMKQLNYVGIEWPDGDYDKRETSPYLYIDGILYDCDIEDAKQLDSSKKPFEINGTGTYYVVRRQKLGYELFPVNRDFLLTIDEFKKELKKPLVMDINGNRIQQPTSIGYAVVMTKKEYEKHCV